MKAQRGGSRNNLAPYKAGDAVRLTPQYRVAMTKQRRMGIKVDWKRVGVVVRCSNYDVSVLWPNRSSVDIIPLRAVEKVPV